MSAVDSDDIIVSKQTLELVDMSIEGLEDYLKVLGAEIDKVKRAINTKHKARKGADSIFT